MVNVYLIFNGNCREAVEYYASVFGTEIPQIMTMGEAPEDPDYPVPEEYKKLIMFARLNISGSNVMFSDNVNNSAYAQGNNISLTVVHNNENDLINWFERLKDGGKVELELQETFWSKCYGSLTDRFGIHWQLSHQIE
ncbi:VOC family protein [Anaerocolumna sp. MB42-C2]|uniref:VOC family protein n=1 Tax=Anaerocolumna sp. MB42-C2 TaxID=3070997 RepID=UPI0027E0C3D5|nr:VOC family protein [Anaerocolumna sp. MB42-C2]WMJ87634.1 VOC family protein [Anaerocolumna sp. MB42-C2]